MEISLFQALLIAIAAYVGSSTWFLGVGYFTVYRPLIGGTVVGLILGDVGAGMKLGAAINAIYLGFISTGGSLPGDLIFAGYIGTALGMVAGLDAETALSLVVPLGLLGSSIWFFRMTSCMAYQPLSSCILALRWSSRWLRHCRRCG
jgi:PTS system mannose-specific IIC component